VIGVAMKTHDLPAASTRACCTPDDMRDARRVAEALDIPFYVLNATDVFRDQVIRPFAEAYRDGKTPNPCVACNDRVKFRPLLERAELLGAEALATGHYARIVERGGGRRLLRGLDAAKDQAYFLYRLSHAQLARLCFPLGGMTKPQVREHAVRLGLAVAGKAESQEICFVGEAGYAATVEQVLGAGGRRGPIVDGRGVCVGHHDGVHHFTLGQRRGLGVSAAEPLYVTGIDAERGIVRVGGRADLLVDRLEVEEVVWTSDPPRPDEKLSVQQRYREVARLARVEVLGGVSARILFDEPAPAGAPGQAAVVFRGDEVVGGGVIQSPSHAVAARGVA
jgi:tRNA-specific 2-thiouridylase